MSLENARDFCGRTHALHVFIWSNDSMINKFKKHQELIIIAAHDQRAGRSALLLPTCQQAVQHCSLNSLLDCSALGNFSLGTLA